jgi:hypothetical protein
MPCVERRFFEGNVDGVFHDGAGDWTRETVLWPSKPVKE